MKKISLIILSVLFIIGCREEKEVDPPTPLVNTNQVEFTVRLKTENDFIIGNDTALLKNGYEAAFSLFKIYLSNLKVVDSTNSHTDIGDVVLVDPIDINNNTFTLDVPYGTYDKLNFGLGLDAQTNNSQPSSFQNEHPLSTFQSMYWSMLKYRFAKIEGKSDLAGNFGDNNDILLSYHTGTDAMYRTIEIDDTNFDANFVIDDVATIEVEIIIDLDKLFDGAGGSIDISNESSTHSTPAQMAFTTKLTDNLASSFTARFSNVVVN
jgi:hypothetical protein